MEGVSTFLTMFSVFTSINSFQTMVNYFYTNENGNKISVSGGQLKLLAKNGIITPFTIIENEEGKKAPARRVKGLAFDETVELKPTPQTMPSQPMTMPHAPVRPVGSDRKQNEVREEYKLFDLNIEKVLEHWGLEHALREIIANALDEQVITTTKKIEIFQDGDSSWHIRDYGRGIEYRHFVQNESVEKLTKTNLIGKFGVGLKDALAVFWRNNIGVVIHSKFSKITLTMAQKSGFALNTLHAVFEKPERSDMVGTEFIITGIPSEPIAKAKSMFLVFGNAKCLGRVCTNFSSRC